MYLDHVSFMLSQLRPIVNSVRNTHALAKHAGPRHQRGGDRPPGPFRRRRGRHSSNYAGPVAFELCVIGLGYVGLPTALSLTSQGRRVLGVDISQRRLAAIRSGDVDVLDTDHARLDDALRTGFLELTDDPAELAEANSVIVCVPTPIDHHRIPDLTALKGACDLVVTHARAGQTLILTSTSYVGTTKDLLIDPLDRSRLHPGRRHLRRLQSRANRPGQLDASRSTKCRASSVAMTPNRPTGRAPC